MANIYKFSVLRLVPDARRGETINIGIVVFREGEVDVHILPSMRKVQALNANIDIDQIFHINEDIVKWTSAAQTAESAHQLLQNFGGVSVSELGWFTALNDGDYSVEVSRLMKSLVTPPSKKSVRSRTTRLQSQLKKIFIGKGVLGHQADDINDHKIIPHYPISEDGSLYVDFALKNGKFHVTETVDFRVSQGSLHSTKLKEVGLKAITLDQAFKSFGGNTARYFIYAANASVERQISSHLNLVSDYSDKVLNFESQRDRAFYMDEIMSSISPDMAAKKH